MLKIEIFTLDTNIKLIFSSIMTEFYCTLPTITLKSRVTEPFPQSNKDTLPMYIYISSTHVSMTSRIRRHVDSYDNIKLTSVTSALPCDNPLGGIYMYIMSTMTPPQVVKGLFQSFEIINQAYGTLWLLRAVT